jgi:hypothetical protein
MSKQKGFPHDELVLILSVMLCVLISLAPLGKSAYASTVYGYVETHGGDWTVHPTEWKQTYDTFTETAFGTAKSSVIVAGTGFANAFFTSQIGVLQAFAGASFPPLPNPGGYATAMAKGSYTDTILVTGAGKAGDPVSYTGTLVISGTHTNINNANTTATASSYFSLKDGTHTLNSPKYSSLTDPNSETLTFNFDTKVGQTLTFMGHLELTAYVSSTSPDDEAQADYSNSGHFYLTPSLSGLNTIGTSGHDFAAPVPIPGAIWLLTPGLTGLIGLKRKYLR